MLFLKSPIFIFGLYKLLMGKFYVLLFTLFSFFYSFSFSQESNKQNEGRPFIFTIKTDNVGFTWTDSFKIVVNEQYNDEITIDWGDGTIDELVTTDIIHTYQTEGTYQIKISGQYAKPTLGFDGSTNLRDANKVISVDQWGDMQWRSFEHAFWQCTNLNILATDTPDLSLVTDMEYAFRETDLSAPENQSLANWDVSSVINMSYLFTSSNFNQDITDWNVSLVRGMLSMFLGTPLQSKYR